MLTKKKIALISIFILILGFISFIKFADYYNWNKAVEAAGGFPYQIGLTNVSMIQCVPSCCAPVCSCCVGVGGVLCSTKDVATCSMYQEISGTPAGGMGSNALFSTAAITQAGLSMGGQLIAGGMSPALMDSGVLASAGGCSGCTARIDISDKIKDFFNKVYVALIKD